MLETREPAGSAKEESPRGSDDDQPMMTIRLDWSAADGVPAQHANVVQVQFMGTDMLLTLGVVLPTIAMVGMTPEQTAEYLRENRLPVRQITKAVLSQEATRVLASHLQLAQPPAAEETES